MLSHAQEPMSLDAMPSPYAILYRRISKDKEERAMGDQIGEGDQFVDKWCAHSVRKISSCRRCLHFAECSSAGRSVAPRAMAKEEERRSRKISLEAFEAEMPRR